MATRPSGQPLMRQKWGKLLFMHWPIAPQLLRPLVPASLEIDTFDGVAWIAIVPFTMWDIRGLPPYLPTLPGLNAMHELNVRTYVSYGGVAGVWFFSLDCTNAVAVFGARTFFYLPYFRAAIKFSQDKRDINYSLSRKEKPPAYFKATWEVGSSLATAATNSLEFFLTERYCLYSQHRQKLYRANIHHAPWPLQHASLHSCKSTMIEALGLPSPEDSPLLHYAEELAVDIWGLKSIDQPGD